ARSEAAAAGVRDDPQGGAHVQPARRARRHFGHRTRRVHRTLAHAVEARRAGVCRLARGAAFPAPARRTRHRARMTAATLVVELLTEELPPKALQRLGEAFAEKLVAGL